MMALNQWQFLKEHRNNCVSWSQKINTVVEPSSINNQGLF